MHSKQPNSFERKKNKNGSQQPFKRIEESRMLLLTLYDFSYKNQDNKKIRQSFAVNVYGVVQYLSRMALQLKRHRDE